MRIKKMTVQGWKSFANVELELSHINVIVGRNNSGKSALLRAAQLLQPGGASIPIGEIRLGSDEALVQFVLQDYDVRRYSTNLAENTAELAGPNGSRILPEIRVEARITKPPAPNQVWATASLTLQGENNNWGGEPQIPPGEPGNYIYPYLSKRKVSGYDRAVDLQKASQVSGNLLHLPAKVARLAVPGQPGGEQFVELCERLLQLRLGAVLVDNGQLAGFSVGRLGSITIESMGEGVASILGLITDLCVAENNLFLIEEPENDIHPQGLKALLDVIIEKSAANQFIVSTHSNIVVKYLASAPDSRLFNVVQRINEQGVPTSTVELIDSPEGRSQVLRDLGYDLHDFDLAEGWLILEESSAESIIRDYLIPWFAPKLTRIRTVAARGTGEVEMTFREFGKLVLFIHREETLKHRAWVIVDGEPSGIDVVRKLTEGYKSWPADRFRTWSKAQFEEYYPARFDEQVTAALATEKRQRQAAKNALRQEVQDWCDENRELAKEEFAVSASEVIDVLREIERELFG